MYIKIKITVKTSEYCTLASPPKPFTTIPDEPYSRSLKELTFTHSTTTPPHSYCVSWSLDNHPAQPCLLEVLHCVQGTCPGTLQFTAGPGAKKERKHGVSEWDSYMESKKGQQ